jgi:hypothetical protein
MKKSRQVRIVLPLTLWIVTVWMGAGLEGSLAAPPPQVAGQSSPQAQIDKGRVALTQICVGCHDNGIMRMLEVREKSVDDWRETVYRMIGRGAMVLPDEIEPLTAYLASISAARRSRPAATATTNQDAQGGEASAILARRCQQCHDMVRATTRSSSQDWRTIIDRMITLGAAITPAEQQILIPYLTGLQK